jgi:hypothetical protein
MGAGNIRFGDETKPRADDRVERWFWLRPARLRKPAELNALWQEFRPNI